MSAILRKSFIYTFNFCKTVRIIPQKYQSTDNKETSHVDKIKESEIKPVPSERTFKGKENTLCKEIP